MDKLKEIDSKIEQMISQLDQVARELSAADCMARPEDIEHIGEALSNLSEVRTSIYLQRPDLMPDYLADINRDRKYNQELGHLLQLSKHLLSVNKPREAILALNKFMAQDLPKEYLDIALSEMKRIEESIKQKKHDHV